MTEVDWSIQKFGKLSMFLKREIVVKGQTFRRETEKNLSDNPIDIFSRSVFKISQERVASFPLHKNQNRPFAILARFNEISLNRGSY